MSSYLPDGEHTVPTEEELKYLEILTKLEIEAIVAEVRAVWQGWTSDLYMQWSRGLGRMNGYLRYEMTPPSNTTRKIIDNLVLSE
jgi:hypothetical protein